MSDEKYVGAIAAAKNAALTKAALEKKLDKTGGTITGSLKVDGLINAGNSLEVKSDIDAEGHIYSGLALLAPSLGLNNEAEGASVFINCSGDNAARITSLSSDGKSHYSRFAVGTPTGDNDAATKAYVDDHAAGYEVITVTSTEVSDVGYDASEGAHKFAVTFDASFDSILANLAANKSMKFNIALPDGTGSMPISFNTGYFSALNNGMFEFTGTIAGAPIVLSIGGLGSAIVYIYADYLPDPNPDGSDDGKALVVNKHKWEMKKVDAVTDVATESTNGLMSASDKTKLNGIATGATRTTVDRLLLDNSDNPVSNRVLKAALDAKAYKTVATAEADGLMSASDKSKLGGIEYGANKTIVDAALDASSTNTVQNKAVKAALDGKAGTAVATTSANGLMSAADKTKLDGVEAGANKTTVDAALDAASENPVQNKAVKAALDGKLDKTGGTLTGNLRVTGALFSGDGLSFGTGENIHFTKAADDAGKLAHGTAGVDDTVPLARLKVASPTEDDDAATKAYVDGRAAGTGAVRYDAAQTLDEAQQFQARKNIGAIGHDSPQFQGFLSLAPANAPLGTGVGLSPIGSGNNFTLDISDVNENTPTLLTGVKTPTDADTNAATTVEYVKNKVSEVAASGGVDVDNALSATSTNPVQNKVVTAALTGKAGTAVATTSANGLMSKADKTKLNGIAAGATKITIDSAMSGSSNNPVANHVIKQYIDDKVAAAGSNITVDATLSSTSANPVQNKAVKAAIDGKLSTSGGTLTGNLTGKYITGTWLRSTEASDLGRTPGKIAVLDDSGWVYYRTPAELVADLGIANAIKSYVDAAIIAAINSAY